MAGRTLMLMLTVAAMWIAPALLARENVAAPAGAGEEPAEQESQPRLTSAQRRTARLLVARFRRSRRDLGAQVSILNMAMQSSPAAVEDIRALIEQQLAPKVAQYRADFVAAAGTAVEAQFAKADMAEVTRLQQTVNALRTEPNLSKEQIAQVADPAMDQLAKALLVDRSEVLGKDRRLVNRRESLMPEGKMWEMADAYLTRLAAAMNPSPDGATSSQAITFEEYLRQEEELAVQLALPMGEDNRTIMTANQQLARQLDPEEAKCVLALNLTRILLGLKPVRIDLKLTATARDHSHDMRELQFFAHESPVPGKKTPWDRAKRFGTSASAENIAAGYGTGPAANLAWFHSPGHHKNMLGNHTRVGVGREGKHWTEMFGRD